MEGDSFMPFYDALKFLMTTSDTKITREHWPEGYYLTKKYSKEEKRYYIMIYFKFKEGLESHINAYKAEPDDLTAEDWKIVK
jgi:hypothetical protein